MFCFEITVFIIIGTFKATWLLRKVNSSIYKDSFPPWCIPLSDLIICWCLPLLRLHLLGATLVISLNYFLASSRNAYSFLLKCLGVSEITWSQAFCLRHHQQNWTVPEGENHPGWWQPETGWHAEWTQRQMGYHLWKICGKVTSPVGQSGCLVGFFQVYNSDAL